MNNAAFNTYKSEFRAVIRQVLADRIQITSIAWLYWSVPLFDIFTVQA
jgi:hypothetical protein